MNRFPRKAVVDFRHSIRVAEIGDWRVRFISGKPPPALAGRQT